jgi:hypothetical protein
LLTKAEPLISAALPSFYWRDSSSTRQLKEIEIMTTDPKNPTNASESIDPELAQLTQQCDSIDAELEKLTPEERKQRICASLGLSADASNEELEKAIEADLLADPAFPDLAEELAQAAKTSTLMTLAKEKLDESSVRVVTAMLKKYDGLAPAERRVKILALYDLGATASDVELEGAVNKEISDSFEAPISPELAQQIVTAIVDKAKA